MSIKNPIIKYISYIPQQDDIENNFETDLKNDINEKISDIDEKICLIFKSLSKTDDEILELKEFKIDFISTRCVYLVFDIICLVLIIVIYNKVYS